MGGGQGAGLGTTILQGDHAPPQGPRCLPADLAAASPRAVQRLLVAAGGEAETLSLHPISQTLSLADRQHRAESCLAPGCCFPPGIHGEQVPESTLEHGCSVLG